MTGNLEQRLFGHKTEYSKGFTQKYDVKKLVYYEFYDNFEQAILREKQLKAWKRAWKIRLIEDNNPEWSDLAIDWGNN